MADYTNLDLDLKTLEQPDGTVPETRMANPEQTRDIVTRALQYDSSTRDVKRARLKGLVDGNPPYNRQTLLDAGRGDECNVNWRIAKYFLGLGKGMLYDVFSEAESYTTIELDPYELKRSDGPEGTYDPNVSVDQADDWSRIITEEFQRLQTEDPNFDYCNQLAQGQSVFYGCGPMHFADELDWRPVSHQSNALVVQEIAKSNTNYWEWAGVVQEYSPDQLYARIANTDAARSRGWDVKATRVAIMNAHPLTRTGVAYQTWSWHQAALKNGSFFYADQCKRIRCVHFYFREFPEAGEDEGKITEAMIELDPTAGDGYGLKYLFWGPKKFSAWREIIHPMYWDHDLNGYHYSVNGLGLEMYAALEYLNRLYCRQADDAFAPKLFFKPTTASERERMSIAQVGRYAILPSALEMIQQHMQPLLTDGIAMSREIQGLVSSNLSQYRSSALSKQQGNPVTARQIDYEASEQAKMGKTQLARIYEQYDWLYAEKYRRATNSKLTSSVRGGKQALQFAEWCRRRGVPKWALTKTRSVKATRVVGQGSQFMRQQALEFLLGLMSTLPETGRFNLIRDVIASRAGQAHVDRYAPAPQRLSSDEAAQQAEAMLQVSSMKVGVPPVPVPTQNPMIFASVFLQAAEGAMQALSQGGDPHETASFLSLAVPAIAGHLQRMAMDKTRAQQIKPLEERWKKLAKAQADLTAALEKQAQEQQAAQQQAQSMQMGQDPETQVGMAKVASHERMGMAKVSVNARLKNAKQEADTILKAYRQQSDLALSAARTQADAALAAQQAQFDNQIKAFTAANEAALAKAKNGAK